MAKKLLLADDSLTIQKVVGISFANEDIQITTVDNGDDALVKVREVRPDIVLADVVMPGKNGYEVCAAIKADPELGHVPVLLLTGTFEAFDEERARRARADGHITKPFEAQTLVDEVNRLLARAARAPVAAAAAPAPAATPARPSVVPELRPAPPPTAPIATPAPAAAGEDAFDFFDEDLAAPAPAAPVATSVAAPQVAAAAPPPPAPATTAFELDAGESAFDFAPVVDEPPTPSRSPSEAPTIVATSVTPHSDRTLALGPESAVEDDWPSGEDLDAAFDEEGLGSLELELDGPRAPRPAAAAPSPAEKPTVLAFDPPAEAPEPEFDFGFDSRRPARQARDPLADFDTPDAAREALLDPDAADAFAVSSSDLGSSFGRAATPRPPLRTPTPVPTPVPTPEPEFEPEIDFAAEPEFSPRPDLDDDDTGAHEVAVESAPVRAAVAADPEPASAEVLTPAMRERVHDSLEKIAWEAFADLPDTIVRQAVAKIEEIAWEVIPQLAEALIREEIRKLKGDD